MVLGWNISIFIHTVSQAHTYLGPLRLSLICKMRIKLTSTSGVVLRLNEMDVKSGVCSKCPTEGSHHYLYELAERWWPLPLSASLGQHPPTPVALLPQCKDKIH